MRTIAHISDIHFGSVDYDTIKPLITAVREVTPDLVVISGDLTQRARKDEFVKARDFLAQLPAPQIVVPGNHDSRHLGNRCFEELIKERYGILQVKDHGFKIIGLDSSEPDLDYGKVGRSQQIFMEDAMKTASKQGLFKIIALHHHIIPVPRTGRDRNVLSDAGDILMSLIENHADLVLSGHKHVPHTWIVHETVFATAGTVSSFKLRGKDTPYFNTININEENIDILLNTADGETRLLAKYENRCR